MVNATEGRIDIVAFYRWVQMMFGECTDVEFDVGIDDLVTSSGAQNICSDQTGLSASSRLWASKLFNLYDADKSGDMSVTEFTKLCRKYDSCMQEESVRLTFEACGAVGGRITMPQFLQWCLTMFGQDEQVFEDSIRELLSESGDQLNSTMPARQREWSGKIFKAFDTDHSGSFELGEFTQLYKSTDPRASQPTIQKQYETAGGKASCGMDLECFERWIMLQYGDLNDFQFEQQATMLLQAAATLGQAKAHANARESELEKRLQLLQKDIHKFEEKKNQLEQDVLSQQRACQLKQSDLVRVQNQVQQFEATAAQLKAQVIPLTQQKKDLEDSVRQQQQGSQDMENKLRALQDAILIQESHSSDLTKDSEQKLRTSERQIQDAQGKMAALNQQLSVLNAEVAERGIQSDELKLELARLNAEKTSQLSFEKQMSTKETAFKNDMAQMQTMQAENAGVLTKQRSELDLLQSQVQALEKERIRKEKEAAAARKQVDQLSAEYVREQNRISQVMEQAKEAETDAKKKVAQISQEYDQEKKRQLEKLEAEKAAARAAKQAVEDQLSREIQELKLKAEKEKAELAAQIQETQNSFQANSALELERLEQEAQKKREVLEDKLAGEARVMDQQRAQAASAQQQREAEKAAARAAKQGVEDQLSREIQELKLKAEKEKAELAAQIQADEHLAAGAESQRETRHSNLNQVATQMLKLSTSIENLRQCAEATMSADILNSLVQACEQSASISDGAIGLEQANATARQVEARVAQARESDKAKWDQMIQTASQHKSQIEAASLLKEQALKRAEQQLIELEAKICVKQQEIHKRHQEALRVDEQLRISCQRVTEVELQISQLQQDKLRIEQDCTVAQAQVEELTEQCAQEKKLEHERLQQIQHLQATADDARVRARDSESESQTLCLQLQSQKLELEKLQAAIDKTSCEHAVMQQLISKAQGESQMLQTEKDELSKACEALRHETQQSNLKPDTRTDDLFVCIHVEIELDLTFESIGENGSNTRTQFEIDLKRDLATCLGLGTQHLIQIVSLVAHRPVLVTSLRIFKSLDSKGDNNSLCPGLDEIDPNLNPSPGLDEIASKLELQSKNKGSLLYQGLVTQKLNHNNLGPKIKLLRAADLVPLIIQDFESKQAELASLNFALSDSTRVHAEQMEQYKHQFEEIECNRVSAEHDHLRQILRQKQQLQELEAQLSGPEQAQPIVARTLGTQTGLACLDPTTCATDATDASHVTVASLGNGVSCPSAGDIVPPSAEPVLHTVHQTHDSTDLFPENVRENNPDMNSNTHLEPTNAQEDSETNAETSGLSVGSLILSPHDNFMHQVKRTFDSDGRVKALRARISKYHGDIASVPVTPPPLDKIPEQDHKTPVHSHDSSVDEKQPGPQQGQSTGLLEDLRDKHAQVHMLRTEIAALRSQTNQLTQQPPSDPPCHNPCTDQSPDKPLVQSCTVLSPVDQRKMRLSQLRQRLQDQYGSPPAAIHLQGSCSPAIESPLQQNEKSFDDLVGVCIRLREELDDQRNVLLNEFEQVTHTGTSS
eukprot:TRINITY_DN8765_c0_g1_i5.p1 TRINITY_DN8765_c0_g1~~TRINITY_DN8765_c0_g1_i5.p1  ORF type:complete len:1536 (-),score=309.24 TRINITY_DN8765_c0_g1_i5:217-4824(-)